MTTTTEPLEWSSEDAEDAFDLADDPIWGDLYRDLIRDRYAQFYKVIARHRPAIEAALRRDEVSAAHDHDCKDVADAQPASPEDIR